MVYNHVVRRSFAAVSSQPSLFSTPWWVRPRTPLLPVPPFVTPAGDNQYRSFAGGPKPRRERKWPEKTKQARNGDNGSVSSGTGGASSKRRRNNKFYAARYRAQTKQRQQQAPRRRKLKTTPPPPLLSEQYVHAVPPAMLVPTASPFVYVSKPALGTKHTDDVCYEEEEQEDDTTIDPKELFPALERGRPQLFLDNEFVALPSYMDHIERQQDDEDGVEMAVLGRSNVGKSSLLNAIMNKQLAITSKAPGRTQKPYYYGLVPRQSDNQKNKTKDKAATPPTSNYCLIDLPGYGYGATTAQTVVEGWQGTTQRLLQQRRDAGKLKRLFLLLDSRRDTASELDRTVVRWLEDAHIPFTIVLTKADRVSVPKVVKQVNEWCLRFAAASASASFSFEEEDGGHTMHATEEEEDGEADAVLQSPVIHVTSAKQNWGINELLQSIDAEFVGDPTALDDEAA